MNLGIVVLEYARAIKEEKIHWWDNLVIQYIQKLTESTNWINPRSQQLFADLNQNKDFFLDGQFM